MPSKAPHGIFELAPSQTIGLTTGLVYGACALILVLLILGVYLYWRKKNKARPRTAPGLTPWEHVHLEFRASAAAATSGDAMKHLNHSFRHGLELKLGEPYTAYTSNEILTHLQKNSQFSSDFQAECAEFLRASDKVLFAYQALSDGERRRWEKQVEKWLNSMQSGQAL